MRKIFPNLAVIELAGKILKPGALVLDLGCHSGANGKALKQKVACRVWGIDVSPTIARQAKKVLDRVIIADITRNNLKLPTSFFDLIIMSNILEHITNPLPVLIRYKKFLKKNGYILIALPNVAFLPVRLSLLLGKFEYKPQGILDKTHLRFFTQQSAKKMIKDAGLEIRQDRTNYFGWRQKIYSLWPQGFASQFIFLCQK